MGYSTDFEGKFALTPPLTRAQEREVTDFCEDMDHSEALCPRGYCGWEVTDDGASLEWDGGEKFDHYVEWLQYLHDRFFGTFGVTVSGSVSYQGEDPTDFGQIEFKGGVAVKKPGQRHSFDELNAMLDTFKLFKAVPKRYSNDNYDVEVNQNAVRVVPKGDTRKALVIGMMLMEGITLQDRYGRGMRVEVTYTKDGEPKGLRLDQI